MFCALAAQKPVLAADHCRKQVQPRCAASSKDPNLSLLTAERLARIAKRVEHCRAPQTGSLPPRVRGQGLRRVRRRHLLCGRQFILADPGLPEVQRHLQEHALCPEHLP